MRILVTGSRDWANQGVIMKALLDQVPNIRVPVTLVSGNATGADRIAEEIAEAFGWTIERHPADWSIGRNGGTTRNLYMIGLGADVCLAFSRPCRSKTCRRREVHSSHGTDHCMRHARTAGIPVRLFTEGWE